MDREWLLYPGEAEAQTLGGGEAKETPYSKRVQGSPGGLRGGAEPRQASHTPWRWSGPSPQSKQL